MQINLSGTNLTRPIWAVPIDQRRSQRRQNMTQAQLKDACGIDAKLPPGLPARAGCVAAQH
jgi:hypothetical protein